MKSSRFGRIRLVVSFFSATLFAGALSANFAPVCPSFESAGSAGVGYLPVATALGDFNGDGKTDLAVANSADDNVTILLGGGTGGFSEASGSPLGVGDWPAFIAVGDFDGDGKLDLAVANKNSNNVSILLGDGTGGFSGASGSPVTVGEQPQSIAAGDFNRDGKLDLAVAEAGSGNVSILLGDGTGGFAAASPLLLGYSTPETVVAGDFNRDGKLDLAVAYYASGVRIFLGDGAGGFTEALGSPVSGGANPYFITAADFNGDGKLDLAVANNWTSSLSILLGDGAGGFSLTSASPIDVGSGPNWVSVGDLDGDGKPDLVVANFDGNSLSILLGDGAGGFGEASISPVYLSGDAASVAIGDFNRDGKADLAVANWLSSVSVLLNTCETISCTSTDFEESAGSPVGVGTHPSSVALGDFNRDGKLDFAVANADADYSGNDNVSILLGDGTGGFSGASGSPVGVGDRPIFIAVGDFNRDGKLDFAVANSADNNVSILLGDGVGGFSEASGSPVTTGFGPVSIAVGDFNRDGNLDLAVANAGSTYASILMGNGLGGFTASSVSLGTYHYSSSVVAGDFNGDGKLDLAFASSNGVRILLGDGTGSFSEAAGSPPSLSINAYSLATADFNGDGKLDLAVVDYWNNYLGIVIGDGAGGFSEDPNSPIKTGAGPNSVAVGDFDGDGHLDLAVANFDVTDVNIFLGDGAGGFTGESVSLPFLDLYHYSAAIGDFDGNGKADLAVSAYGQSYVRVLLNACSTVVCVPTETAVTNVSMEYDPVDLTATVSSTTTVGGGTVTFSIVETGDVIGSASVSGGTATLAVAAQTLSPTPGHYPDLAEGNYTIKADYGGSASFCASSKTGTLTVSWEVVTGLARALKEGVLSDLQAIRATVTDKGDRGKLDDAIKHLTKSLDPHNWLDDSHVRKGHAGESVFNEEKPAADRLRDLIHRNHSGLTSGQLQPLIDSLFAADRGLADTAIDDAIAASGKSGDIKRAKEELARGDASASAGRTDAIDHYKNAWKAVVH